MWDQGKRKTKTSTAPPWKWTDECETAINKLKNALTDEPILGYPDFRRPYTLYIDASFCGLGAVLSQEQEGKVVSLAMPAVRFDPLNEIWIIQYDEIGNARVKVGCDGDVSRLFAGI